MPEYEVIFEQKASSLIASIKSALGDKYDDVTTGADEVLAIRTKKRLTPSERDAVETILGHKIKER